MAPTDESLFPIAVLIDELRDDDIGLKLNSIRRLGTIALALGEERSRTELVPYLADSKQDDDEVLVALAEEIGKLVPHVGGPAHAHCLISLLEELAKTEETVVRDEAVNSMNKIGEDLSEQQIADTFIPALKKLACGEWFTSRVSACGLFAVGYKKADVATCGELRTLFKQLCRDDTPMVRRAAALSIGDFAASVEPEHVQQSLLPLWSVLMKDDQESVRKLSFESSPKFVAALKDEAAQGEALDVVLAIMSDRSWRVRHCVSERIADVAEAFGPKVTREHLVAPFAALLQDAEPEVRMVAAEAVATFSAHLTEPLITASILPHLKSLAGDSSQFVRTAAASVVMALSPMLGKEGTVTHLLDLYVKLLTDKCPEVRLNVISNLEHANKVLGEEHLTSSLLPAIEELAADKHWRVRLAIIEKLPVLADQLGMEFYEEKLLPRNREWLKDCVATIRTAAATALVDVARNFGETWAQEHAVPELLSQLQHGFYLQRITILQACAHLADAVSRDTLTNVLLPSVLKLADDRVPNVRFNLCQVLQALSAHIDSATQQLIQPVLEELANDADLDVKYFAQRALSADPTAATVLA